MATGEEGFGHREHLEFAWAVLDEAADLDDAIRVVSLTIRHLAIAGGTPDKYHETVTIFWLRLLAHLRETHPRVASVGEMIDAYPDLGVSKLPETYWSDLDAEEARQHWVEPDLRPLP